MEQLSRRSAVSGSDELHVIQLAVLYIHTFIMIQVGKLLFAIFFHVVKLLKLQTEMSLFSLEQV